MNKAIAEVYSITIGHQRGPQGGYTDRDKDRLIDCIPKLISEIERLQEITQDPFVRGYIERFGLGKSEKP